MQLNKLSTDIIISRYSSIHKITRGIRCTCGVSLSMSLTLGALVACSKACTAHQRGGPSGERGLELMKRQVLKPQKTLSH